MTSDVDEVGEGMHLVESASIVVPGAPHFLAASHMRDGIDEAAIQQTQARRRKARIDGQPVGAVGVLQQRRGAVELHARAVHQGYGDACAVARRHEQKLGAILGGVEAADDRIALQQNLLAAADVVVVDRGRRGERGIRIAHEVGIEFRVDGE